MTAVTQSPVRAPQPGDLALTYRQPWASLTMVRTEDGGCLKPVENRGWPPPKTLPQWSRCPLASCGHTRAMMPDCYTHGGTPVCIDHMAPSAMVPDGPYPFRLWVHAGQRWDSDGYSDAWVLAGGDSRRLPSSYPHGFLLGSVLFTGCHEWRYCPGRADIRMCSPWAEPDQYHWLQTDPQPLPEPIPMRGRLKLWRITADDLKAVPA